MKNLIKKLVETYGPAGSEEQIGQVIAEEIKDYVDGMQTDALGNLIAHKKGPGKKLMLAAHMDEIGVMVTHIDDKGFLRFYPIGGLSPFTLLGNRCCFANGTVGIFGAEKIEAPKELRIDKLFIDIGANSKEEAKEKVSIGDTASLYREFTDLGSRLVSKAMDNRISCAILIQALKEVKTPAHDIYAVFTTQEEVGLRGARVSAYGIDPDMGIAIDVTRTGDTPEAHTMDVSLGKGPTVKIRDSSLLCSPQVIAYMRRVADTNDIPYQLEVLTAGGTDSAVIQLSKAGVPAGVMSVPCRYIHTVSEMVDFNDVTQSVKFLTKILETADC